MKYTVEQIRVGLGFSKAELAKLLCMHVNTYNNKISGRTNWDVVEIAKISELSGYDISLIQFTK